MTTFSQLVDEMTKELIRPDLKGYIASSINQVIREVHTGNGGSNDRTVYRFNSNRVEEIVNTGNLPEPFLYAIPNFNRFQALEAIWVPRVSQFARNRPPGSVNLNDRMRINDRITWYQTGNFIALSGYQVPGIDTYFSMFYYPRSLVYHKDSVTAQPSLNTPVDPRWASYDVETETWTYRTGTPYTDEQLKDMSTNWLLERWTDLIREGVRAKVYKRLGDQTRMSTAYSNYMAMRGEMQIQEITQMIAFNEG